MEISITTEGSTTTLQSPYHVDLPPRARKIGGKYAAGAWRFDARDEERVCELARRIFGTDVTPCQTIDVRVDVNAACGGYRVQHLWMLGRELAGRSERDKPVRLGDGVVIVSGGFPRSGGSVKNPGIEPHDGTVLEVRDVPVGHADLEYPYVTILEAPKVDREVLTAERERLTARIAEIDALLAE